MPEGTVSRPSLTPAGELFGRDVYFAGDYGVSAAGDYLTVEGIENLRASIFRRIMTIPGEYAMRPGYGAGLRAFVKRLATSTARDEMTARIRDQLLQDERIESVDEVTITQQFLNGQLVTRVIVRATALGQAINFRPFEITA